MKLPNELRQTIYEIADFLQETHDLLAKEQLLLRTKQPSDADRAERERMRKIGPELLAYVAQLFQRFERLGRKLPESMKTHCHALVRRQLHPFLRCSPFINRIYQKPLGFAGDYGMLDKMLDDPWSGPSMYAKLINAWFVNTPAGLAYRERIELLSERLQFEVRRAVEAKGRARVLSLGCGAATEIKRLLEKTDLSDHVEVHLLDFNEATLEQAKLRINEARSRLARSSRIVFRKESVQGLLKQAAKSARGKGGLPGSFQEKSVDFVYCMGLFDYFSDEVNSAVIGMLFDLVAPDGSFLACNFIPENPNFATMEYIVDWHLLHRSPHDLLDLVPKRLVEEALSQSFQLTSGAEAYLLLERH